jgi:hypothetical protein
MSSISGTVAMVDLDCPELLLHWEFVFLMYSPNRGWGDRYWAAHWV